MVLDTTTSLLGLSFFETLNVVYILYRLGIQL